MLERLRKASLASEVIGLGRVLELENFTTSMETAVCQQFRELNLSDVSEKKSEADSMLTALATHALRRGCSAAECQSIGDFLS